MDFVSKLKEIEEKFEQVNEQLSDPEILSDQKKLIKLSKERSTLEPIVNYYNNER